MKKIVALTLLSTAWLARGSEAQDEAYKKKFELNKRVERVSIDLEKLKNSFESRSSNYDFIKAARQLKSIEGRINRYIERGHQLDFPRDRCSEGKEFAVGVGLGAMSGGVGALLGLGSAYWTSLEDKPPSFREIAKYVLCGGVIAASFFGTSFYVNERLEHSYKRKEFSNEKEKILKVLGDAANERFRLDKQLSIEKAISKRANHFNPNKGCKQERLNFLIDQEPSMDGFDGCSIVLHNDEY